MIKRILCGIIALAALVTGAHAEGDDYCDIVRLHVIANSDSTPDQAFKLRVRDVVLDVLSDYLQGCESYDQVYEALVIAAPDVQSAAQELADREGYAGKIHVETGEFAFDAREFDGQTVPAGEYRAMRVVIGSGEGHNWWSIMYPEACRQNGDAQPVYYSALIEWLMDLWGGEK